MRRQSLPVLLLSTLAAGCAIFAEPLPVVPKVGLQRYLGKWYEIAHYPAIFQRGCFASTAEYSLREDGDIEVINRCNDGALNGPLREVRGRAWVVDKETNAKLKVRFFWPFWGSYWVIGLADDYSWAVVGHPSREYLWILSRTPQMDAQTYEGIIALIKEKGYDPAKLVKTEQRAE